MYIACAVEMNPVGHYDIHAFSINDSVNFTNCIVFLMCNILTICRNAQWIKNVVLDIVNHLSFSYYVTEWSLTRWRAAYRSLTPWPNILKDWYTHAFNNVCARGVWKYDKSAIMKRLNAFSEIKRFQKEWLGLVRNLQNSGTKLNKLRSTQPDYSYTFQPWVRSSKNRRGMWTIRSRVLCDSCWTIEPNEE